MAQKENCVCRAKGKEKLEIQMTVSEWFTANKPKTLDVRLKVKCPDGQARTICLVDFMFHWKVAPDSVHNWEVIEEVKDHRHD